MALERINSLERTWFIGTGYLSRDAADTQTLAVCTQDVALIACGYMADREPVILLYASTGMVLACLPWPSNLDSADLAVRWAVHEVRGW